MGFGKAQKQERNRKAKKEAREKLLIKAKKEESETKKMIGQMDDNCSYRVYKDGKPVLNGMIANARFWKAMYGVE